MAAWAKCKKCNTAVGKINLIDGVCFDNCKIAKWKVELKTARSKKHREKMLEIARKANKERAENNKGWPKTDKTEREAMRNVRYDNYNQEDIYL